MRLEKIGELLPGLSRAETLELAAEVVARAEGEPASSAQVEWDRYQGTLRGGGGPEPLEYQRAARAEWD